MAEGVQIYGAFDVGVLVRGSGDVNDGTNGGSTQSKGTESQVASGMDGHNGIGFRMSEDLGNGMKIAGDAMFGFALDSGQGPDGASMSTIYSYLSLSGDFGTVIAGRAGGARAGWIKKYDPFGGFGVAGQLAVHDPSIGSADYADNVLAWITPEVLPGLKGLFAYTSNLVGQDNSPRGATSTPLYAIAAMYDQGPLSLVANYEKLWVYQGAGNTPAGDNTHVVTFGGSYDFGVMKVFALADQLTKQTNGWQVGVSAPVGESLVLKAGYAMSEVRGINSTTGGFTSVNGAECKKFGVGGVYTLSKRTSIYADAARIDSDNGSACALRGGLNTYGGAYAGGLGGGDGRDNLLGGFGEWGTNVGVRHTF